MAIAGAGAFVLLGGNGETPPVPSAAQKSAAGPVGFQPVYAKYQDAIVRLDVDRCDDSAAGSGFFIDKTHILTAAHVVDRASHIRAEAAGRPISTRVIGIDRAQDLALLAADTEHRGATIELSEKPGVGAPVAAIGFARGEDLTLTTGTVSGVGRKLERELGTQRNMIQTDAAVDPGTSGGPLLGAAGRAVGVVASKDVFAESTAFAVGADAAAADVLGWIKRPEKNLLDTCDGSRATADAPSRILPSHRGATYATVQEATATCTAPMSQDNAGRPVAYYPDYLIDGNAATAWRCAGDGKGVQITLTYPYPVTVGAVGLTPGYAKYDPADGEDRYSQNRRVASARWTFDDGTSVTQRLDTSVDNRSFQARSVPVVTTRSIVLTILKTSKAGSRDYTAISEVGVYSP